MNQGKNKEKDETQWHTQTLFQRKQISVWRAVKGVCVCMCDKMCTCTHTHTYVYIHTYTYFCMYMYMHLYMHLCLCVYNGEEHKMTNQGAKV